PVDPVDLHFGHMLGKLVSMATGTAGAAFEIVPSSPGLGTGAIPRTIGGGFDGTYYNFVWGNPDLALFLRPFAASGLPIAAAGLVVSPSAVGNLNTANVVGGGLIYTVWDDNRSGRDSDIYGIGWPIGTTPGATSSPVAMSSIAGASAGKVTKETLISTVLAPA